MKKLIIFLSLAMTLTACGQKGPLYLEPKAEANQQKTEPVKPAEKQKTTTETKDDTQTNKK